jgi:hypothetical protein
MKIDYDPAKNAKNIEERGLSFELAEEFNFESALIWQDVRSDYGELRFNALGYIDNRVSSLNFMVDSGQLTNVQNAIDLASLIFMVNRNFQIF